MSLSLVSPVHAPLQVHMFAPYRSSPFVDFNAGVVSLDPIRFVEENQRPWDFSQEVDFFQCRVETWQLSPAVEIIRQIEAHDQPSAWSHAAYAPLFILTPYFEMVGKILNRESNEYKTSERDFNRGFCSVYPEHRFSQRVPGTTSLNDNAFPYIAQLRDRLRNGLSHVGFTKKTFDIHNSPDVPEDFEMFLVKDCDPYPIPLYVANPHRITRTLVEHFGTFIGELRASTDTELHAKFIEFVWNFHVPRSIEVPTS